MNELEDNARLHTYASLALSRLKHLKKKVMCRQTKEIIDGSISIIESLRNRIYEYEREVVHLLDENKELRHPLSSVNKTTKTSTFKLPEITEDLWVKYGHTSLMTYDTVFSKPIWTELALEYAYLIKEKSWHSNLM